MLADLQDRLGQPVQRRRRQAGCITGPLVLGNRVEEEALLVALAAHDRAAVQRGQLHRGSHLGPHPGRAGAGGLGQP